MNYDETPERDENYTGFDAEQERREGTFRFASEPEPEDQAQEYLAKGLGKRDAGRIQDAYADFAASVSVAMYEIRTTFLGLVQDEKFQALLAACEAAAIPVRTVHPPMSDDTDAVDPADDIAINAAPHWVAGVTVGRVKSVLDEATVKYTHGLPSGERVATYDGGAYNALAIGVLASLRNNIDLFKDRKIEASDLDEMIEMISGREH